MRTPGGGSFLSALPLARSLRHYGPEQFRDDLVAGLTTAVMLIPQAMGYAMLAGLPPIYGLYACLVPISVYALLGTSRQLSVGPVALDSLLTASAVGAMAVQGTDAYLFYAIVLAFLVGLIQFGMGIGRLGFLVNFLSRPVISGFMSAAALIIGFSQLSHLLGIEIPRSNHVHIILAGAVEGASRIHGLTVALGLGCIVLLVCLKRFAPRFPRALFVVAAASLGVLVLGLDKQGVAVVGAVPSGFPSFVPPSLDWEVVSALMPAAFTVALVAFMEAIAVGKKVAATEKYQVDANQELIALGLSNLVGSFFQSYSVTGGLSRTSVNAQAGAKTQLASLITALAVALTLMFLTPLFHYLPTVVLAAIIVTAVAGLIDVQLPVRLWRIKKTDLGILMVTFLTTLFWGIQEGIGVGVAVSLALLVLRSTRPHVAVLGHVPDLDVYRNVKRFKNAETIPGVLALRLDAQIFFGNVNFLTETLHRLESESERPLRAVVLDASGVNQVDASAAEALFDVVEEYRGREIRFVLANVIGPVRDVLRRAGFFEVLGPENFFLRIEDAVASVTGTSTENGEKGRDAECWNF